jgi:hypothetical protein
MLFIQHTHKKKVQSEFLTVAFVSMRIGLTVEFKYYSRYKIHGIGNVGRVKPGHGCLRKRYELFYEERGSYASTKAHRLPLGLT